MNTPLSGRRSLDLALRVALVAAGWGALAVQWVPDLPALRAPLVFAFFLFVPGAAVVTLLPVRDRLEQAMLAVAISVAAGIIVSEALALAHAASAKGSTGILAVLTTVIVVIGAVRERRQPRSRPTLTVGGR